MLGVTCLHCCPTAYSRAWCLPGKPNLVVCASRAPEQWDAEFGLRGSHTDVWGFGTCILHLATGQLPYQGLTQLQMVSAMYNRRIPDIPTSLVAWLRQALKDCLSFDTAARPSVAHLHQVPQTASTVTVALVDFCGLHSLSMLEIHLHLHLALATHKSFGDSVSFRQYVR